MSSYEQSEEDLFLKCLELPREERNRFIESACPNNPQLRESLIELIRSHEETEGFMDTLVDEDSALVAAHLQRVASSDEGPGDQIGRYRLEERIGEGAWGTVWIARQTEDIDRQVALKILKLGLDTKDFLIRFEAERQVLAMMDHPNIATIHDAGATEFGRPYLVMELVEGYPLLEYANENRLTIPERVELFIRVCKALDHAHSQEIIHRDIKPSNILVAESDEGPVPKVIDFGVAKTNQFRLGDKTQFTNIHTFIGTPLYSSPEQLEMLGEEVDGRSDVYSLGAVLYELLVGCSHFDGDRLTALGIDGFRTYVKEKDPPRPSLRFDSLSSEQKNGIAHSRDSTVARIQSQLKGDIDWVVMKCLEKDRDRRYETAATLALDLQAFLEFRPVSAAAPSIIYRTRKFLRRNASSKTAWTALPAAVLCFLAIGLYLESRNRTPIEFASPFALAIAEGNRSIAVLPFENLSSNDEDAFLADGFHSELTSALSGIRDIKTISLNSAIRYRDTNKSSKVIGEELGAITLLTGGVQRSGDQIRISVQLVDAIEDRNLWGETYTRQVSTASLFGIQSEISSAITRQLNAILTVEESNSFSKVPTQNFEALEAYFKGKELLSLVNRSDMPKAIGHFKRAIELDPEFTLAYVGLAHSYAEYRTTPELKLTVEQKDELLLAAANKAFVLDHGLPEVQVLQGTIHRMAKNYEAALAAYRKAIELNPNYAEAYYRLALYIWAEGWRLTVPELLEKYRVDDPVEAHRVATLEMIALLEKAVELDPTNPSYRRWLGHSYGDLDQKEEEIAQLRTAVEMNPNQARLHWLLGGRLGMYLGRYDEAMIYYRKSLALDQRSNGISLSIEGAFERMGDTEEAIRWRKRHMALAGSSSQTSEAKLMMLRGEEDTALGIYRDLLSKSKDGLRGPGRKNVLFDDLRKGQFQEARDRYFAALPELFEADVDIMDESGPFAKDQESFGQFAMELAPILIATGETEQAYRLMDETWIMYEHHPRGFISEQYEAMILALRGDKTGALAVIRKAVEEGFRIVSYFDDPRISFLRDEPDFIELHKFVKNDLAKQLANVRRMEANGEFEAIPPLSETSL